MRIKTKVTAVFDIGKTNKKFFLFDSHYQEVYREYTRIEPIEDEDGHPTENLASLQVWLKEVFDRILNAKQYSIKAINFSTYGASLVHLDEHGEIVTPLYNYTKPFDEGLVSNFFAKYGPQAEFAKVTGSTDAGMLSSGMQLYWLKHTKPEVYKKIAFSLHLPQYISYIFTGIPLSEYTSIGCHTGLWNYGEKDYHDWVYAENIHKILPPIVSTETSINMNYNGKRIKIGVGIHDSSAALLPYVRSIKKKFILVSTGTWSIALNPFCENLLSDNDIEQNCINYMRINGKPAKASRLFLGNEYSAQVKQLTKHFQVSKNHHKSITFDHAIFFDIINDFTYCFRWQGIADKHMPEQTQYRMIPSNMLIINSWWSWFCCR